MAQYNNSTNSFNRNSSITTTAVSYTVLQTDYIVEVTDTSAPRTITLPASSTSGSTASVGKRYIIKDTSGGASTNSITITPASGTIDGAASYFISQNYGEASFYSDGTNYFTHDPFFSRVNVQTFSASGTYTPTQGMKYCIADMVGGGGGGGGLAATSGGQCACASQGGNGGYARVLLSATQIGSSQAITIGAAGISGASGGGIGGTGGTTSIGGLVSCAGGVGGNFTASITGGITANGGLGGAVTVTTGNPIITLTLNGGQAGVFNSGTANQNIAVGFAGPSSPLGGGYPSVIIQNSSVSGFNPSGHGAGGGGALIINTSLARAGAAGGAGVVIITEYI